MHRATAITASAIAAALAIAATAAAQQPTPPCRVAGMIKQDAVVIEAAIRANPNLPHGVIQMMPVPKTASPVGLVIELTSAEVDKLAANPADLSWPKIRVAIPSGMNARVELTQGDLKVANEMTSFGRVPDECVANPDRCRAPLVLDGEQDLARLGIVRPNEMPGHRLALRKALTSGKTIGYSYLGLKLEDQKGSFAITPADIGMAGQKLKEVLTRMRADQAAGKCVPLA